MPPKSWKGCTVTEVHEDGTRLELGVVAAEHWRSWGRRRDVHVHSLTLDHRVHVGKQRLRTVLVWSGTQWHNRLHRAARYTVY